MRPIHTALTTTAVFLVAVTSYAAGVQSTRPARLSGDQLVVQLLGDTKVPTAQQDAKTLFAQRYAEGYLDGVVDATQGRTWCAPPRFKTHELDDRVFAALKKRPRGSMPGAAADQLVEQYQITFPCQ